MNHPSEKEMPKEHWEPKVLITLYVYFVNSATTHFLLTVILEAIQIYLEHNCCEFFMEYTFFLFNCHGFLGSVECTVPFPMLLFQDRRL